MVVCGAAAHDDKRRAVVPCVTLACLLGWCCWSTFACPHPLHKQQLTLLLPLLAQITFNYVDPTQHYHVPLLMSPFSYTTYRGS